MSTNSNAGKRSYVANMGSGKVIQVGDVGAQARVVIGDGNSWTEQKGAGADAAVATALAVLLNDINSDTIAPPAERKLAASKAEAVALALHGVSDEPEKLQIALMDASSYYANRFSWAWDRLTRILRSEAAHNVLSGITEGAVKGAIDGLLGL